MLTTRKDAHAMQKRKKRIDQDASPNGIVKSGTLIVRDKVHHGVELHARMVIDAGGNVKVENAGNINLFCVRVSF